MPSGGGEIIIIALTSAEGLPVRKALSGLVSLQAHLPLEEGWIVPLGVGWGLWPPGESWLSSNGGEGAQTLGGGRLTSQTLDIKLGYSSSPHLPVL